MKYPFFFLSLVLSHLFGGDPALLYPSLDPLSITQNAAFAQLYPNTPDGKLAEERVRALLFQGAPLSEGLPSHLSSPDLRGIISLLSSHSLGPASAPLSQEQLELIQAAASSLANRSLQGSKAWSEEEVLSLPPEEVDITRAVLLCQFAGEELAKEKILQYEANVDLMALQIRARLPKAPSPEDIIYEINQLIFQELGFRFPPHSIHIQNIDLYTLLPSVLDTRRGVCLGVSIMYLALAQRLNLPLEIITPPGHIYLRYRPNGSEEINIETTARGIHLPSENYLGVNTRSLQLRTQKEVVGLALINQASVSWGKQDYKSTVSLYERARPYLPNDPLLSMLLGLNYLFIGEEKRGRAILSALDPLLFSHAVSEETLPADYLKGNVDAEGIKAVFLLADESVESLQKKKELLEAVVKKHPRFRAGLLQLASLLLQMGRSSQALNTLLQYQQIDNRDITVEYYLAALSFQQKDYPKAWHFLQQASLLALGRDHAAKPLRELKAALRRTSPPPL